MSNQALLELEAVKRDAGMEKLLKANILQRLSVLEERHEVHAKYINDLAAAQGIKLDRIVESSCEHDLSNPNSYHA